MRALAILFVPLLSMALPAPAGAVIKVGWSFSDRNSDKPLRAYAVAIDPAGDFYVVGSQRFSQTDPDQYKMLVEKVSSFHQYKVWTATPDGTGASVTEDALKAVAADPSGLGAVVGGRAYSATAGAQQGILAYYNRYGTTAWWTELPVDSVEGVVFSGTSYIFACGVKDGVAGVKNIWVAKYANPYPGKAEVEAVEINGAALAIALDPAGFVYVAGYMTLPTGTNGRDIWLAKYAPSNLAQVWFTTINGPGSSTDFATSVAVGQSGEIYLSGAVTQSGTFFQEHLDLWVGRVDDSGGTQTLTWSFSMDGGEIDRDIAWGVATDANGNVWATGELDTPGSHWADMWLGKFSSTGTLVDSWQRDFVGNGDDIGHGLTVSPVGPVVAGWITGIAINDELYFAQFREWFASPSLPPDFINAYPNPFRPGSGGLHDAAEMVVRSLPPGSTVRFYTLSGALVREVRDADGDGKVSWDGKNASGKDAGSGVYIFAAQAAGSGIKKGKVVIIR